MEWEGREEGGEEEEEREEEEGRRRKGRRREGRRGKGGGGKEEEEGREERGGKGGCKDIRVEKQEARVREAGGGGGGVGNWMVLCVTCNRHHGWLLLVNGEHRLQHGFGEAAGHTQPMQVPHREHRI